MNKKLFLFLSIFAFLFIPKSVFAQDIYPANGYFVRSTYFNNTNTMYQEVGTNSYPYTILFDAGNNSDRKGLFGFSVEQVVNYNNSNKYTKLTAHVDVEQDVSCGTTTLYRNAPGLPVKMFILTSSGSKNIACNLTTHQSWKQSWTCETVMSDYESFRSFVLYVGCLDGSCVVASSDGGVTTDYGCHPDRHNVIVARAYYDLVSTADPSLAAIGELNSSINNQTTIIDNSINKVDDSLNDANFNDKSGFGDFIQGFDSFENNSLTSIITSPLALINSLDDTCSPVPFQLLGTTINIPCGDTIFWGRDDVSAFRTIWNLLLGGPIIYFLLIKLYKVVDNSLRPDKDEIETYL